VLSPRLLLPGLRGHLAKPLRSALMVFGIALGAALCTFIVLINTATLKSLEHSINDLAGETDLTVSALGGESFSEDVFDRLLKIPGVKNAVPLIQNKAFIYLKDGSQTAMTLLGIDLLNDSSVRSPEKTDSRLVTDPLAFMASSDSIALTQVFAKQHRLALQDTVQVVTALGVKRFTIRALIDESGPGKAFGGTLAVMDIEASRVAYGKSGKMDQVNIIVEDRDQLKQTLSRIQDTLGDSFSVEPP
jgi:putative ABC transport system permease protein